MSKKHILYMLFIGSLSTMTYILGASFQLSHDSVILISILPGVTVGLYTLSQKQIIIPIVVGAIIGGILSEQFLFGGITISGLYLTFLRTTSIVLIAVVGRYIKEKFQVSFDNLHTISQIPLFFLFVTVTVSIYTIIMLLEVVVIDTNLWLRFFQRGFSTGIYAGIFGSIIYNSYHHDTESVLLYSKLELFKRFLFTIVFIVIAYLVFNETIVLTTYKEMIIVLGMLYIATAFLFAIRMLFVNNVIILFMYLVLYFPNPTYQTATEIFVISLYLIAMTAITSVMFIYYNERTNTIEQLKSSQKNMEQLIISTNNLFAVQDKLPQYKNKFSREYLADMFRIACNLYPKFDSATCYIRNDAVEFVDCIGYDLDHINRLRFNPDVFNWSLVTPEIFYETNNQNAFPMDGDLIEFQNTYPRIKEALRFTVYVGEGQYGGMSFDILEGSDQTFTQNDIEHFTTFQKLMNSYYNLGENKDKEDDMKNHIVLSVLDSYNLYDQYTGYHSQEVAELASELGAALHLKEEDVKTLYWAGLVHDIGKTGITREILNKQDSLTDVEYDIVKMHPVFAFKILRQYETMENIATIVLHHHEWWNGTGYPNQLKAMAIPYLSQILHVADAVCAMGRNRQFKVRLSNEQIIEQLQAGYGTQFSPKVVREMVGYIQMGKLDELWKHNRK